MQHHLAQIYGSMSSTSRRSLCSKSCRRRRGASSSMESLEIDLTTPRTLAGLNIVQARQLIEMKGNELHAYYEFASNVLYSTLNAHNASESMVVATAMRLARPPYGAHLSCSHTHAPLLPASLSLLTHTRVPLSLSLCRPNAACYHPPASASSNYSSRPRGYTYRVRQAASDRIMPRVRAPGDQPFLTNNDDRPRAALLDQPDRNARVLIGADARRATIRRVEGEGRLKLEQTMALKMPGVDTTDGLLLNAVETALALLKNPPQPPQQQAEEAAPAATAGDAPPQE